MSRQITLDVEKKLVNKLIQEPISELISLFGLEGWEINENSPDLEEYAKYYLENCSENELQCLCEEYQLTLQENIINEEERGI